MHYYLLLQSSRMVVELLFGVRTVSYRNQSDTN